MFETYFEEFDDAPPDIDWFERLWLGTLALTVIITIMMFDWSMHRVGPTARFHNHYTLAFRLALERNLKSDAATHTLVT